MHEDLEGKIDGCGYDGKQKETFSDAHEPCWTIQSTIKPVFADFDIVIARIAH